MCRRRWLRAPGVNLQRGNGQEYLPALRSPVLTGAGACGALLTAEDGIPLTSPGFCNINELFFAHHEAASRIEVLRGPGTAVHGGNALHGVVNVITARRAESSLAGLELGSYGVARFRLNWFAESDSGLRLTAVRDGGFRDDSGYRQLKLNAFRSGGTQNVGLDGRPGRERAGPGHRRIHHRTRQLSRTGKPPARTRTPKPSAGRSICVPGHASSIVRTEAWSLVLTPYLRYSRMRFQDALPARRPVRA